MNNVSAEQVLVKYKEGMGEALGSEFYYCRQQFLEVTFLWDVCETLFGSKERVELLNATIDVLAVYIRNQFLNGVALGVARLLDPPSKGKFENLTLSRVCESCPTGLQERATSLLAEIHDDSQAMREIRNKLIAHNDLAYATRKLEPIVYGTREKITNLLRKILALFNIIDLHYLEQFTSIIPLGNDSALRMLVNLQYGHSVGPKIRDEHRGQRVTLLDLMQLPEYLSLSKEECSRYSE
jgi:AbiU2